MSETFGSHYERGVYLSDRFGGGRDTSCPKCGLVLAVITLASTGCPVCNKKLVEEKK